MSSEQLTSESQKKRKYQCRMCNKAFSRPSALRTHGFTHTGEKPFQCTIPGCGRRFAVISNLRRHYKVHNKTVHTNKIPAGERLRHVQQLMERTTTTTRPTMSSSSSPPHPSSSLHYPGSSFAISNHHYQTQQHHPSSHETYQQQQQQHYFTTTNYYQHPSSSSTGSKSPISPITPPGRGEPPVVGDNRCQGPSYNQPSHQDTYGPPLTPTPGNTNPTLSYFKSPPPPKVPFVVMSESPQHHHHHHHAYYREPPFHHWDHHSHPPSSFGQA